MIFRTLITTIACTALAAAQLAPHLWLVGVGGAPVSNPVIEVSAAGQVVATHPGPLTGARAVVKDLQGRVIVLDGAGQSLLIYKSGTGLQQSISVTGMVDVAVLPSGTIAVASKGPGGLGSGQLQLIPLSGAWPQSIPVGPQPLRVVATRGETAWVLGLLGGVLYPVHNGVSQPSIVLSGISPNPVRDITVRPGGGLLVSFRGSPVVGRLDESGTIGPSLVLPEPPLQMTTDGDRTLLALGESGQIHRVSLDTGAPIASFYPPPSADLGALVADQRDSFWLEDSAGALLHHFGPGNQLLASIPLSGGTRTRGDPLGFQYAAMVKPLLDADSDGVSSEDELHRGSRLLDGTDVPPGLSALQAGTSQMLLDINAPGRGGQLALTLLSVTGTDPGALGETGAPYLDLTLDFVFELSLYGQIQSQPFLGLDSVVLDASGTGTVVCDFSGVSAVSGTIGFHACTLITKNQPQPGHAYDLTDVVSNPVSFLNL